MSTSGNGRGIDTPDLANLGGGPGGGPLRLEAPLNGGGGGGGGGRGTPLARGGGGGFVDDELGGKGTADIEGKLLVGTGAGAGGLCLVFVLAPLRDFGSLVIEAPFIRSDPGWGKEGGGGGGGGGGGILKIPMYIYNWLYIKSTGYAFCTRRILFCTEIQISSIYGRVRASW